jgi:hypothetical protein
MRPQSPLLNDVQNSSIELGELDANIFNDSVGPPSTPM